MKKSLTLAIVTLLLSGCVSPERIADQHKQAAVAAWVKQEQPLMHAGTLKASDYYMGLYDRLSTQPITAMDLVYMRPINNLIAYSKEMEAGKISADEFAARKRDANIAIEEGAQRVEAEDAQQQREVALMFLQTRPTATNCISTGSSSCTTW